MAGAGRASARARISLAVLAVAGVAAVASAAVLTSSHSTGHGGDKGGSASGQRASGGHDHAAVPSSTTTSTTTTLPPTIALDSVSPANGTRDVAYRQAVTVSFSAALAPSSPHPVLIPAVTGQWSRTSPTTWRFQPDENYPPLQQITVAVPGGASGVTAGTGATLTRSVRTGFQVAGPSVLRLQQLLAELDYLPVTFVPDVSPASPTGMASGETGSSSTGATGSSGAAATGSSGTGATGSSSTGATGSSGTAATGSSSTGATGSSGTGATGSLSTGAKLSSTAGSSVRPVLTSADMSSSSSPTSASKTTHPAMVNPLSLEATSPGAVDLDPLPGHFVWRFPSIPSQLASQWAPGEWNVVTQGAVMAFEYAEGLDVDGQPGPQVWSALLAAVAKRQVDTNPYDYLLVTETLPETLYVWRDGQVIYQSLANTGVYGATTALGTFPVYLRYTVTTM
ncbi:MAG TPA: Ig-like domain-containing protein, partial [Acidimicrobiales bacterium]|nr:Ig-like domain-containing protein [Acidimicrobiales bacterium]